MCARVAEELLPDVTTSWLSGWLKQHCSLIVSSLSQDVSGYLYRIRKKMFLTKLIVSSSGEKDIPGLTDTTVPRRLGPKRASKIRKLFNLAKEDDVRQYVVRRPLNKEGETPVFLNNS